MELFFKKYAGNKRSHATKISILNNFEWVAAAAEDKNHTVLVNIFLEKIINDFKGS